MPQGSLLDGVGGGVTDRSGLSTLPAGSTSRTYAAWVQYDRASTDGGVIIGHGSIDPGGGYKRSAFLLVENAAFSSDPVLLLDFQVGFVRSNGLPVINDGKWHHIAATFNVSESGTGVRMYVDGAPVTVVSGSNGFSKTSVNTSNTSTRTATFGYEYGVTNGSTDTSKRENFYKGLIDDAYIYSRALSASEVLSLYQQPSLQVPTEITSAFRDAAHLTNDTSSIASPTYAISAASSSVNEGSTATFTVSTTNVAANTSLAYTVSGISSSDLTSGSLSGNVTIGSNGQGTISLPIRADSLTEGTETMTVTVQGKSASVSILDTSTAPVVTAGPATKTYAIASTQATVRSSDGGATWTVATPSGTETLTAVDRLRFNDKTIALDFDKGEAGYMAATLIGTAFGKSYISQYLGAGLSLFDAGKSIAEISSLVIETGLMESLIGSNSTAAWVRHVYKNVVGVNPDAFTEAIFKTYLDRGTYTRASLLEAAAGVDALAAQIDLVGIRSEGISYVPWV